MYVFMAQAEKLKYIKNRFEKKERLPGKYPNERIVVLRDLKVNSSFQGVKFLWWWGTAPM